MVNVFGVPVQLTPPLVKVGVTTIVATIGIVVAFEAVNEISPVPVAGKLILVSEFVQE
jgi:hypothetical protein